MKLPWIARGWTAARLALDEVAPSADGSAWSEAIGRGWSPNRGADYCGRCGATMPPQAVLPGAGAEGPVGGCAFCRDKTLPWDALVRLGPYESPLSDWILAMKFARRWTWAPRLGVELAMAIGTGAPDHATDPTTLGSIAVCPVPMHWRRRWARGFNQAHLMAQALAQARSWPMVELLRRSRWTSPQVHVPYTQRAANIQRSFAARAIDLAGWDVWLVDDIKTSGATLNACARLLRDLGARRVCIAVAAVADPRGSAAVPPTGTPGPGA